MDIKQRLRENFFIHSFLRRRRIKLWRDSGSQVPVPHDVKQLTICYYSTTNKLDTLVETGTFMGDTVWAQKDHFGEIYSIELSQELFMRAKRRFRNDSHVRLIQGDSSVELRAVVGHLRKPALFWLDGHYSGGITARGDKICPIFDELQSIFESEFNHTILIDDARLFIGKDDYPTMQELTSFIGDNGKYTVDIENDIIVLLPL